VIVNYLLLPPPEGEVPKEWTVRGLVAWSLFDFLSFVFAM